MNLDEKVRITTTADPRDAAAPEAPSATIGAAKIFGIGLSKTGTTSLANALGILGYRVKDNIGVTRYVAGDLSCIDRMVIDANDAFTDTPIPSFYRELDARYPGSKFILTVRDADGWLKSCKKQFNAAHAEKQNEAHKQLFTDLYDCAVFDAQKFGRGYERFVRGVDAHFADRPQDLLVLDIAAGDGWEKLCPFLGRPLPDIPFPKANVTQIRWINIKDVVAIAQAAGREIMGARNRKYAATSSSGELAQRGPTVWGKILSVLRVRKHDELKSARKAAYKVIVNRLTSLNAEIPVLSPEHPIASFEERKTWNHFWLVDALGSGDEFSRGRDAFTISIALIEDSKPIYGVVYALMTGTVYYAKAGEGTYKIEHGGEPIRLAADRRPDSGAVGTDPGVQAQDDDQPASSPNRALALCALADGHNAPRTFLEPTMEWETAAAHAILRTAGMRLVDCKFDREITYNKQHLTNESFTVQ